MRRKRIFRKNQVLTLDIQSIAFGGKGIARQETDQGPFVIFVQNALPGQRVKARVVKCKSKYAECNLDEVLQRSPREKGIPYQEIPGAPYAHLPIEDQHALKEETALELYRKIGNVAHLDRIYQGLIGSPENWHYRNKMEYSFSAIVHNPKTGEKEDRFGLGFKRRGTWWAVEDLNSDSGLFDADIENVMPKLREYFASTGLPAWHPPRREGFFRFLVVRKSIATQRLLINLVTTSEGVDDFDCERFITKLKALLKDRLQGVLHTINDDKGERVEARAGSSTCIYGDPFVTETLHGLNFDVEMASFFQTNPASAGRLYEIAITEATSDWNASGPSEDYVMDLFCGTGTIAQLLACATNSTVIGVDIVQQAIMDARRSAQKNGIRNAEFHVADVGKFLLKYPEYVGKIKTIVLDPPRAGISPKTLRKIIRLKAKRMVYISCNPATQARDVSSLAEAGYDLTKLTLLDQFPHTAHVEAVGVFEKTADL
ncbi:MAG TPA: 23S rRNA (uracil(1939)-C(5))-methyltransferase RlmD [Flavobacteriales bacterium]|nr:23S rRNA (uracil(1939)-C(5))-methyltransferase RlmD [Flavobacteriales bacterium]